MEGEINITEKDVNDIIGLFAKVPAIMLRRMVSKNMNVVKSFESQIESYESQLSAEEIAKIKKIIEMPISELQELLNKTYMETGQEQLKILADPGAEPFIAKNLQELKRVLF